MKKLSLLFLLLASASYVFAQTVTKITSDRAVEVLKKLNLNTSVIIDGRDSAKFYSGHIKNAIYIDAFETNAKEKLQKQLGKETIFVYCTMNKRSETIIKMLQQLNYGGTIINMTDGVTGWNKNGFDLEVSDDIMLKKP